MLVLSDSLGQELDLPTHEGNSVPNDGSVVPAGSGPQFVSMPDATGQ